MRHIKKLNEYVAHEKLESPTYEALEEAFMQFITKGAKIDIGNIEKIDPFNNHTLIVMKNGDMHEIHYNIKKI